MAALPLCIPERLRRRVEFLARQQGVILNDSINAALADAVAQEEALQLFEDRLNNTDLDALHRRVLAFMGESRPGPEPTPEGVLVAVGKSRTCHDS